MCAECVGRCASLVGALCAGHCPRARVTAMPGRAWAVAGQCGLGAGPILIQKLAVSGCYSILPPIPAPPFPSWHFALEVSSHCKTFPYPPYQRLLPPR